MSKFRKFFICLTIALCLAVLTVTVLDEFNPLMHFLTSIPSKVLIFMAGAASVTTAAMLLKRSE